MRNIYRYNNTTTDLYIFQKPKFKNISSHYDTQPHKLKDAGELKFRQW